jgi:hypothetical protein
MSHIVLLLGSVELPLVFHAFAGEQRRHGHQLGSEKVIGALIR